MSAALRGLALALLVGSCANAGNPGLGDDQPKMDAAVKKDSGALQPDTPPPIDGAVDSTQIMIDAPPDSSTSGPFCDGNGDCTVSGECCFSFGGPGICVPGTPFAGACIPSN